MKKEAEHKEESKSRVDIPDMNTKFEDQPAEEFIDDKADWSEDISEYKKSRKKGTK